MMFLGGVFFYGFAKRALSAPLAALLSYGMIMWTLKGFEPNGYIHFASIACALCVALWLVKLPKLDLLLCWVGLIQALFGIAQWFGWNPWNYNFKDLPWAHYKPTGFFSQETLLGAFLVACLAPALFSRRWWAFLPITACIAATHSTMSCASATVVYGLFFWKNIGKLPVIAVSAIFGAFLVVAIKLHPDNPWFSDTERFRFWRYGLSSFLKRPLFGHGPGSWLPSSPMLEQRLTHLHNEYLEFLTEYGSFGAAIGLWGVADFLRKFRLTWHHALVVGLAVDAFGNFPFHIASLGTIFLTAWLLSVTERPIVIPFRG